MNIRLLAMILSVFGFFGFASTTYGQVTDGTYPECIAEFEEMLSDWQNLYDVTTGYKTCYVNQGTAHVYADGLAGAVPYEIYAGTYRFAGTKRCQGYIKIDNGSADWYFNFDLPGKDTSQWNKYMKAMGCDQIIALD